MQIRLHSNVCVLSPSPLMFSPSSSRVLFLFSCVLSFFCLISLSFSYVLPSSLVFSPSSRVLSLFFSVLSNFSPVLSLIFSMLSFVLSPGLPFLINILHKVLNVNIPEHGSVEIFYVNLEQTSTALILIRKHFFLLLFFYLIFINDFTCVLLF